MVKSWLVQDQTVLGKDYSNLLIADSLLKTIWFINAPCYGNEALASPKANELTIPEQTATGKGTSNPFMAAHALHLSAYESYGDDDESTGGGSDDGSDTQDKKKKNQSKTDKKRKRQDKSEETAKDQSQISPTQQERKSKAKIMKPRTESDKFSKSQGLIWNFKVKRTKVAK
ncbi:hypothetical protein Tco_0370238 [Tanacetum coccineum]